MRTNNERGSVLLLELLIVIAITAVLLAASAPNALQMMYGAQFQNAKSQVTRVLAAQAALSICTAQQTNCGNVGLLVPQNGTLQMQGFNFTFVQNGNAWSYTAAPIDATAPMSVYADQSGVLRCSADPNNRANAASQPCP